MGLLENLKKKIFGQKKIQIPETKKQSNLDLKKFEQEAMQKQGNEELTTSHSVVQEPSLRDILQEKTEKLGEKVIEKGKDLKEKGIAFGNAMGEKAEALLQKAEKEAAKEKKNTQESFLEKAHRKGKEYDEKTNDTQRTFQDSLRDAEKSNLKEDFFAKAAKFAKGEYGGNNPKPTLLKNDNTKKTSENRDKNNLDDLIEDAIIEK